MCRKRCLRLQAVSLAAAQNQCLSSVWLHFVLTLLTLSAEYEHPSSSIRSRRLEEPPFRHATHMDMELDEEKGNFSHLLETFDYSHGDPTALGPGRVGSSTIQTVDYHHGRGNAAPDELSSIQDMAGNFRNPVPHLAAPLPPPVPYGGHPAYSIDYPPGSRDYPPGGSAYPGQIPAAASYFSNLDHAMMYAAYNEQAGEYYSLFIVVSFS